MASKKPILRRGLDQLLSNSNATLAEVVQTEIKKEGELRSLPIEIIQRGKYQPRKDMKLSALEELASSIRSQGILQPVVVRPIGMGRYEIIAGERRWRAAQMAGLDKVPAIVREVSDEATMAMALIENIQRENLNPLEEAVAIQRLIDDCLLTHQQVAESIGKSRSSVTNLLRLLALNSEVRELIETGKLEAGHGKVLLALEGPSQTQAARTVVAKGLSVRETERLIRQTQFPTNKLLQTKSIDPDIRQLQNQLSEKLGSQVQILHSPRGKGKLVIHYHSLEALDGILEHIQGEQGE